MCSGRRGEGSSGALWGSVGAALEVQGEAQAELRSMATGSSTGIEGNVVGIHGSRDLGPDPWRRGACPGSMAAGSRGAVEVLAFQWRCWEEDDGS